MPNRRKKPYSISEWIFAIIFTLIGIGAFIMGEIHFQDRINLENNGHSTKATIIDIEASTFTSSGGHRRVRRTTTHYSPVVRFTDDKGISRIGKSKVASLEYKNLEKGSTVTITYLPDNPTEIILAGDSTGKSAPIVFMAAGGLFCAMGGFLIYKGVKK